MNKLDKQIQTLLLKDAPQMPKDASAHFDETLLRLLSEASADTVHTSSKKGVLRKLFCKPLAAARRIFMSGGIFHKEKRT